ncbi:MAG: TIGR04282 family arsenosugar biosynthesis glycosyltransferase [Luteibaculum sp.]
MSSSKTAILLFSLEAHEQAIRKPIMGQDNFLLNRKFWSTLKRHTIKIAKATGIQVEEYCEQEGENFGERLSNAIAACYQKGYDRLIVLGNDNPNLNKETLLQVSQLLNSNQWVLEPSEDGGVNILGINKQSFNPDSFANLPWHSEVVFNELVDGIRNQHQSLAILEGNPDIDSESDLKSWLENPGQSILAILVKGLLLKNLWDVDSPDLGLTEHVLQQSHGNKAPPAW